MLVGVPIRSGTISKLPYWRQVRKFSEKERTEEEARPHRACVDQINTLRILVEQSLEYRSPLYMIFVDF